jgi:hypothetical protein
VIRMGKWLKLTKSIPDIVKIIVAASLVIVLPIWFFLKGVDQITFYNQEIDQMKKISTKLKTQLFVKFSDKEKQKALINDQLEKLVLTSGDQRMEFLQKDFLKGKHFDEALLYLKNPVWVNEDTLQKIFEMIGSKEGQGSKQWQVIGFDLKKNSQTKQYQINLSLLERRYHY